MRRVFQPEWRTQNRIKRRIYAKYMGWMEKVGYAVVLCVFAAFIFAFNYKVEDVIKADGVTLGAAAIEILAEDDLIVVAEIPHSYDSVDQGQILLEVVKGQENIARYKLYLLNEELNRPGTVNAPRIETVRAPSAGVVQFTESKSAVTSVQWRFFAKGEAVAKMLDYSKLEGTAELEGNTVAKAKADNFVRVSNVSFAAGATSLFRASSSHGDVIASRIFGDELSEMALSSLKGKRLRIRDDLPLEVKDIKQIQIDARMLTSLEDSQTEVIELDPRPKETLSARVLSGSHEAVVQVAELPAGLHKSLSATIASALMGKTLRQFNGQELGVESIEDPRFVLQVQADAEGGSGSPEIPATVLSRKYVARIQIKNPSPALSAAVLEADRRGKPVTARVEQVTGTRPIAFILLKRS